MSGARITLTTRDGFALEAWREPAREARRGGLVICHAMWGVTPHLKLLAHDLAGEGYEVLVPSLLDRFDPGGGWPEADTTPALFAPRDAAMTASGYGAECMAEVQATVDALAGPVFVMGFCFGGTVAWLAACRCNGITASASFYGGHIVLYRNEVPRRPAVLHFGKTDELIPPADVEAISERHPDLPIYLYDAGHAFVAPNGYHKDSAELSMLRTRAFFHRAGGAREAGA